MRVAEVYINIPVKSISKSYIYIIPPSLNVIERGYRVLVPFAGRKIEAFVITIRDWDEEHDSKYKLKEIIEVLDEEAWFTSNILEATEKLAEFYLAAPAEIMRLFMPGKSGLKINPVYKLLMKAENEISPEKKILICQEPYREICDLLSNKPRSLSDLRRELVGDRAKKEIDTLMGRLVNYGICQKDYLATKREKVKYGKYYARVAPITEEVLISLERKKAQLKVAKLFENKQEISYVDLVAQSISKQTLNNLVQANIIKCVLRRQVRDSYNILSVDTNCNGEPLTLAQKGIVEELNEATNKVRFQEFLLHGVTGSGKTRVYIELTKKVRQNGKQVIVLVPEIALTGQVVQVFRENFAEDIVVLHSQLSLTERNDAIFRVRQNQAGVIIGARSALFTPADNVGAIILDEEQDMSYKQDEAPRYHARTVAEILANVWNCILLLGSATPSLESYARAKVGKIKLLTLKERIGSIPLPNVNVVDMREELKLGSRRIISHKLHNLLTTTLERNEQSIIMLNRRGYATFVMCRACGEALKCDNCSMPMVYHQDGTLVCHHCDIVKDVPRICPKCGSKYIKYFGAGTEKLEQELREIMPHARVIRMDRDTTGKKLSHQTILNSFRRHEYDILLGTQMVAKGHDLPGVKAVGIISADSSLNLPDFRASERCFMLITQTAGRAGRHIDNGSLGEVVVQTYSPEHYAVKTAVKHDYEDFFAHEIKRRKELFYPPFSKLVKLIFRHNDKNIAKELSATIIEKFENYFSTEHKFNREIIGPSPAMLSRLNNYYRYVVLIKTDDLGLVQEFLRKEKLHQRDDVAIDIDPVTIF